MNIDKQDERLLHEILSKYKQGLISGILQGDNITLTPTGCRNKIISSTGGGGSSALFPNGYTFIAEDYEIKASDEGKIIYSTIGTPVNVTMPASVIFTGGMNIGLLLINGGTFQRTSNDAPIEVLPYIGGTVLDTINNKAGEFLLFQTVAIGVGGNSQLQPISTSVLEDNGVLKTTLKYLYDKSQNAIPLSGTEVSNPVTGDIEIADDIKIKSVDVSATDGYLKFRTGQFEQKTTDNIGLTNSEIRSSGTSAFFRVTDNNTGFSNQISVSNVGIDVNSTDPLSRGLSAIQDFSPNITDLDYTQKIYVDNIAGKIVTLGTITFADINAALANTAISINLGNSVPMDYFPTAVGIKLVNSFLQTSPVFCELRIKVGTAASHFMGELLDLFSGVKLTETTNSPMSKPAVQQQDCVELYFNNGGGEVNPQDYTAGEFEVYAICKKYPF